MEAEVNGILVAAHDLRTPISLMRQLALSMDFENDPKNELENARKDLIHVSERALRQVDDLTKLAELGDFCLLEPISVHVACDEIKNELAPIFSFNHKELVTDYSLRSPLAVANRDLLHTVLYHFGLSVAHYSGENSLSILSIATHAGKIRLAMRDFGPSLPLDVWQALRSGWIRQPMELSLRPGSSGLGLYIASRYASAMHAQIGAIRHRDGSTFYVDLVPSRQRSLFE